MVRSLPKGYKSRSTIRLTDLTSGKSDTFNVPTVSVVKKLQSLQGWSDEKLEKVSVEVW